MPEFTLSPEVLSLFAGVILSLLFSYVPGLRVKFAALSDEWKQSIMLAALVAGAGIVVGAGCFDIIKVSGFVCEKQGFFNVAYYLVLAAMANQTAFKLSPQKSDVKAAKALAKAKTTAKLDCCL